MRQAHQKNERYNRVAFPDKLLRYLTASLVCATFRREFARDYWPCEELWDFSKPIKQRWLKMLLASWASDIAVLTVPLSLVLAIMVPFFVDGKIAGRWWWLIGVYGGTLLAATVLAFITTILIVIVEYLIGCKQAASKK